MLTKLIKSDFLKKFTAKFLKKIEKAKHFEYFLRKTKKNSY